MLMTVNKMKQIIEDNVNFKELIKNDGIYEFYFENGKSIGVSYEDIDDIKEVYIYNIFIGDEYINITSVGSKRHPFTKSVLKELVETWNKF